MGYIGYSMSENAKHAYLTGEKPLSYFNKEDVQMLEKALSSLFGYDVKLKLTVKRLKEILEDEGESSWHHTGMLYNATDFYSVAYHLTDGRTCDIEKLINYPNKYTIEDINLDFLEKITEYAL